MEIKITEEQLVKAMAWLLHDGTLSDGTPTCECGELKAADFILAKILWDRLAKGDK